MAVPTRFALGRPFVLSMAVVVVLCLLFLRAPGAPHRWRTLALVAVLFGVVIWMHPSWHLFLVPVFACLLARRFAEAGVRFIEVNHGSWDQHKNHRRDLQANCEATDAPVAALLHDLRVRGMLDETLVVWGGEFGRTPMFQGKGGAGRDHHIKGFSMWMAGGGIKPGVQIGRTDELGFHIVEDAAHVHDVQATILNCLGIDHRRLTYNYRGLDFRLTGVEEHHPIEKMLA